MNKEKHFKVFSDTERQITDDPVLKDYLIVINDSEGKTKPEFTTIEARKLLNAKDKKKLLAIEAVRPESIECHAANGLKYKPSSLTIPKKLKAPLENLEFQELTVIGEDKFEKGVKEIEYDEQLFKEKDWTIVLGSGV